MTAKLMKRVRSDARVILLLLAAGAAMTPLRADPPETLPPGMAKYVLVLWTPGMQLPDGGHVKKVEEPDVEKFGGRVLQKHDNRHEILLPKGAAKQLRKHSAVIYLQRIWMGEPLDDWDERDERKAGFDVGSDSVDTDIDWVKAFDYDGSGNITQLGDDHYTYDSAGRLIRAQVSGKTETYKYDDFGNLTEKAVAGANPVTIPIDASSNRITGGEYDVAGNVTRDGTDIYEYDAFSMMVRQYAAAGPRRILYDADDERLGMLADNDTISDWTIRDFGGQVIREYRGEMSGVGAWYWKADFLFANGNLVAGESQEWNNYGEGEAVWGGKRHYHLDHLGSVRLVTNSDGNSISEHDYYPFGLTMTQTYQEQINQADKHVDAMRYAGHWRDFLGLRNVENTEYLDYMHARYYDPNMGRFLSVDPGQDWDPHKPQSWNLYVYARNNPVLLTDPDGTSVQGIFNFFKKFFRDKLDETNPPKKTDTSDPNYQALTDPASGAPAHQAEYLTNKEGVAQNALNEAGSTLAAAGATAGVLAGTEGVSSATARLTQNALEHVVYRHWAASGFRNVGRFAEGTTARSLRTMVDTASKLGARTADRLNRTRIEVDLGRRIGVDSAGRATTRLRVIISQSGDVITAFPIR